MRHNGLAAAISQLNGLFSAVRHGELKLLLLQLGL